MSCFYYASVLSIVKDWPINIRSPIHTSYQPENILLNHLLCASSFFYNFFSTISTHCNPCKPISFSPFLKKRLSYLHDFPVYLGILTLLITFIQQTVKVNYDLVELHHLQRLLRFLYYNRIQSLFPYSFCFISFQKITYIPYFFNLHIFFHPVNQNKKKFSSLFCCSYLRIFTLLIACM